MCGRARVGCGFGSGGVSSVVLVLGVSVGAGSLGISAVWCCSVRAGVISVVVVGLGEYVRLGSVSESGLIWWSMLMLCCLDEPGWSWEGIWEGGGCRVGGTSRCFPWALAERWVVGITGVFVLLWLLDRDDPLGLSPMYRDDPLGLSPVLVGSVILLRVWWGGVFVSSVRRSWFVSST